MENPIKTIKGIGKALTIKTGKAIYASVKDVVINDIINGNTNTRSKLAGKAVLELGVSIIGAKALDKTLKAGKFSGAGRLSNYVDEIGRYSDDVIKGTGKATNTVWDNIKITQPMYKNTKIPKSFELAVGNKKFWVHPNGTKHMVEYVTRSTIHGMPMNSQTLLSSFQQSASKAVQQGVKYDEIMNIGNWELIFSKPRGGGLLPVIKHAVYRP